MIVATPLAQWTTTKKLKTVNLVLQRLGIVRILYDFA